MAYDTADGIGRNRLSDGVGLVGIFMLMYEGMHAHTHDGLFGARLNMGSSAWRRKSTDRKIRLAVGKGEGSLEQIHEVAGGLRSIND